MGVSIVLFEGRWGSDGRAATGGNEAGGYWHTLLEQDVADIDAREQGIGCVCVCAGARCGGYM